MEYTVAEIASILHAEIHGDADVYVSDIIIDSRKVNSVNEAVFFAIKGENHDGHHFIADLYHKGVRAFVVEHDSDFGTYSEAVFLLVKSSLRSLQKLAANYRKQFTYPVLGITGSNGKTIVKEWIFQALGTSQRIVRSPKSYNSQIGVPLSVLNMNGTADMAVFEAGISKLHEMEHLQQIIQPNIGIITNIGEAHQENFATIEQKLKEKLLLFKHSDLIIYCQDHALIHKYIWEKYTEKETYSWSRTNSNAPIYVHDIVFKSRSVQFKVNALQEVFELPFTDEASFENAMHVFTFMHYLNYEPAVIAQSLWNLSPIAMRLELKKGINHCSLINDFYNSDLASLRIALSFLKQQNQHRKKVVVLSDMLESGLNDKGLYTEVNNLLKQLPVDEIIAVGKRIMACESCFTIPFSAYKNTSDFIKNYPIHKLHQSAILLKGARVYHFERIAEILEEKTHNTIFEINLDALAHNLNFYRSLLKPDVKLMVMVKAFSYGSGSHEIANLLQFHRVDYLGVAFIDEGVALREAGINLPIMVMNPEPAGFDSLIENQLEPEIFSFTNLRLFLDAAKRHALKSYPIHIKIDTGMRRLGFELNELDQLLHELKENESVIVKSVFSHLAASDEDVHDDFTRGQIHKFEKASGSLKEELGYTFIRHISNSSGIDRFPEAQFDMVRLGIGLYGVSGTHRETLRTVGTLKSYISQIKKVKSGETIGYSRKGVASQLKRIATIPIGYADGLNRGLSNGVGYFIVHGKPAPIIGNICMDMCMIDITNVSAEEGDMVIIFGENPRVEELATKLNTIPYEILTSVSERVKRIYFHE